MKLVLQPQMTLERTLLLPNEYRDAKTIGFTGIAVTQMMNGMTWDVLVKHVVSVWDAPDHDEFMYCNIESKEEMSPETFPYLYLNDLCTRTYWGTMHEIDDFLLHKYGIENLGEWTPTNDQNREVSE